MKCFIWIFLLPLKYGVFGADEMKAVTEGDNLNLQTGLSEIQGDDRIVWLYGSVMIARVDKAGGIFDTYDVDDGRLSGKLELDKQTGSLIIKDIRIKNAGDYQLVNKGVTAGKFVVTVYARLPIPAIGFSDCPQTPAGSSSKICVVQCSVQTVGLVTLSWYKGNNLVSTRISDTCSSTSLHLEVDYYDKNIYSCIVNNPISNRTQHLDISGLCHKCAVSGLSPGAVAGIVIAVLLAVAAAVVAGVMYYLRPRITNLPSQTLTVMEGDTVTLNPETEIQTGDNIHCLFGDRDTLIAEINGETRHMTTYEGPDKIFKNRLELDKTTGSLTIKLIRTEHTGFYTLKIRRGREILHKRFIVSVRERMITVTEGESVILKPATEINKDDLIYWMFGDEEQQTGIAEFNGKTGQMFTYDYVADGRFRDRLELDETTGSLIIKNTRTEHSGLYKLQIRSSSGISEQTFTVIVKLEEKFLEEDSVTLKPDTEIQREDQILWMFGDQDKLIAQIKGGTVDIYDDVNIRYKDKLKLDKTGSLTITNIEAEHTGLYKLLIISSRGTLYKKFKVFIQLRYEAVAAGESVHLYTGLTEIQRDDEIEWRFGDEKSLIAEIKGGTGETHDGPDERFRDRLELNETTGDLIIKNSRDEHDGEYKLKIRSSKGNTYRTYIVNIRSSFVNVTAGDSVRLYTDLTEIQTEDEIQWRFGDKNSLIAEIKGGTGKTHDVPDERFRDRLELDAKTGDLIINDSTDEHDGEYKLKICSSEGYTNMRFTVTVRWRKVEVAAGESVHLNTGLTEIQTDEEIEWRFGDKNSLIAEIKGGTGETRDGPDERFRDRLELDEKTGDLIIKNSTDEHTGRYKLKISSSEWNTNMRFIVTVKDSRGNRVNESATVEMPLLNGEDVNVVNEEEGTSSL